MTRRFTVVMDHSRRALTKSEDKLPAISGVASLVQKATGYRYLAGLWAEDIRRSLIWGMTPRDDHLAILAVPPSKLQTPSSPYRAPTWTWASIDEPVHFWMAHVGTPYPLSKLDMELIQGHTSTQSFKPFGQVTGGSIRLRAWSKASSY
jgi:hypothetical protein